MNRDEMSILYRGPSKDAPYQVSIHLAKWFQRRKSETRIACGGHVSMEWNEMSNLYRGPPVDASYQVLAHLTKRFQKRRIFKISQSETSVACGGNVR